MKPGVHYGWFVLTVGVLVVLGALGLARFGYTMILPPMQEGLALSNTETGALATGNFVGYLCLALVGGFLASHFGPRRVIALALLGVGLTMALTGLSNGFGSALVWRTLTGMGSGASNVPMMGLLAAWFAAKRRGLATGIAVAGSSLGLIVTGPLIPRLLNRWPDHGWRISWIVLGGLTVGIAALAYVVLRDHPAEKGLEALGAAPAAAGNAPAADPPRGFRSWSLIYRSGVVWHLSLIYFAFGFSYIIYVTFFAKFLQAEVGFTKEGAGALWQAVGWISISCGLIWGWASDVIGRKYALAIVSLLHAVAYSGFALWQAPVGATASAALFGLTAWSIPAIMASACGDHLGPRLAPAALGFLTLFLGIGQALGPAVAGSLADRADTFVPALLLAAAVALAGAVASLCLRRGH